MLRLLGNQWLRKIQKNGGNVVKKSSDGVIKFYEKSHKYKNGREQYTSVTTLISKHFPKFDAKGLARKLASFYWAKKQGKGVRYWLNEWKQSALTGSLIHEEIEESIIKPDGYEVLKPVLHPRAIIGVEWFNEFIQEYSTPEVIPEELIYDEDFKVAGQIDLLIKDGKEITLVDWKATKDITFKCKYPEDTTGTSSITKELQNANGVKYSLQLSIYAYMLERKGYKVKKLVLAHICPKKNKLVPYEVEYMREEAMKILGENNEKTN